jgi:ethanolamine utilization protein EutP (predicted NTPase)
MTERPGREVSNHALYFAVSSSKWSLDVIHLLQSIIHEAHHSTS